MYSFEQLKLFVAVHECGSISAAARKFRRAQSGVSQAISNLEIELNQTLFDRSRNVPELTPQGLVLLPIAKTILAQQTLLEQKAMSLDLGEENRVKVAIDESLLEPELLFRVSSIDAQFPLTTIELIASTTEKIKTWVSEGEVNFGIVYADGSMPENTDFVTLGYKRFVTVASKQHPLAAVSGLTGNDLLGHKQIVLCAKDGEELWFSHSVSALTWSANNHYSLLEFASHNVGWTIVPEHLAAPYIAAGKLVVLDVVYEPSGWVNTIDLLESRHFSQGPVQQALRGVLIEHFQDDVF